MLRFNLRRRMEENFHLPGQHEQESHAGDEGTSVSGDGSFDKPGKFPEGVIRTPKGIISNVRNAIKEVAPKSRTETTYQMVPGTRYASGTSVKTKSYKVRVNETRQGYEVHIDHIDSLGGDRKKVIDALRAKGYSVPEKEITAGGSIAFHLLKENAKLP